MSQGQRFQRTEKSIQEQSVGGAAARRRAPNGLIRQ